MQRLSFRASREDGATLAEFAFSLPLLIVILYAIFDFGGALTQKQKLGAAVYECARTAASQSTSDLSNSSVGTSGSIANLRDALARNLQAAGINDCGLLGGGTLTATPATFQWVYSASTGCPAPLILTIERQKVLAPSGAVTVNIVYTHVHLDYPYQWRLSRVIQFLVPGGTFPSSSIIAVDANMQNLT